MRGQFEEATNLADEKSINLGVSDRVSQRHVMPLFIFLLSLLAVSRG